MEQRANAKKKSSGFGEALKAARLRAGLKQPDVAKAAGVAVPAVSSYEHGTREPSLEVIARLVRSVGATMLTVEPTRTGEPAVDFYYSDWEPEMMRGQAFLREDWVRLTEEGREKVVAYAKDLLRAESFRRW